VPKNQNTTVDLSPIKDLLLRNRDEGLKSALKASEKLLKQSSLQKDELEILVIAATLLHEKSNDSQALKYLTRYHEEVVKVPHMVDETPAFAWGELLYAAVSTSEELVQASERTRQDQVSRNTSVSGASKAAQAASGGGCLVSIAIVCGLVASVAACTALVIVLLYF
jgi:hypothetical protein